MAVFAKIYWRLRFLRYALGASRMSLTTYDCNVCGFRGYFLPTGQGLILRSQAVCPKCHSNERSRLFKLWFDQNRDGFADKRVLHFAPETDVRRYLETACREYVTADIKPGRADLVLNIERLDLPDESFDRIICSHVLEHVDDRAALSELRRVLKADGILLLMTPVLYGWAKTYENFEITSPEDRLLHFGQSDHVRWFGADIRERITSVGFELTEFLAPMQAVLRSRLPREERIFIAAPLVRH